MCELYYESKHLEEGYPGNLKCIVKYILNNNNEFRIEFNATSDEDTFTLNRGQGDYTAAGAIEWILASGPDYCPGGEIIVPVKIKKKNMGKIINEEYITVSVGEISPVITHPDIKSIKFTFAIAGVKEECG